MTKRYARNSMKWYRRFLSGIVLGAFLCSQVAYSMPGERGFLRSGLVPPLRTQTEEMRNAWKRASSRVKARRQGPRSGASAELSEDLPLLKQIRAELKGEFDAYPKSGKADVDNIARAAYRARRIEELFERLSNSGDADFERNVLKALTVTLDAMARNPLASLTKIAAGDTVVSFRLISGLIKDYNDEYLLPLLTNEFIEKRKKKLRELLEKAGLITPRDFLYRTSAGDVFLFEKERLQAQGLADEQGRVDPNKLQAILARVAEETEKHLLSFLDEKDRSGETRRSLKGAPKPVLAFGVSAPVASDSEEALIEADSQSMRAAVMAFHHNLEAGVEGKGEFYSHDAFDRFLNETAVLGEGLMRDAPRLFNPEGTLHDWVVDRLRKKEPIPGIPGEVQEKLKVYQQRLNTFDYLKPWGVNREESTRAALELAGWEYELGELRSKILGSKSLAQGENKRQLLADAVTGLADARKLLAQSHRNPDLPSDSEFHRLGVKMKKAVYIVFDVLGVGIRNFHSYERAMQKIRKAPGDQKAAVIEAAAFEVGREVDEILKGVHDHIQRLYVEHLDLARKNDRISEEEYSKLAKQGVVAMVGGDEVFVLADPRVATDDFLRDAQQATNTRAIRTAVVELDKPDQQPSQNEITVHATTMAELGKGLVLAKLLEKNDIYGAVISKRDYGQGPRWVALFEERGSVRYVDIEDAERNHFAGVPASYVTGRPSGRVPKEVGEKLASLEESPVVPSDSDAWLLDQFVDLSLANHLRERALRLLLKSLASGDGARKGLILEDLGKILAGAQGGAVVQEADRTLIGIFNRTVASLFDPLQKTNLDASASKQRRALLDFLLEFQKDHPGVWQLLSEATREIGIELDFGFKDYLKRREAAEGGEQAEAQKAYESMILDGLNWLGQARYTDHLIHNSTLHVLALFALHGERTPEGTGGVARRYMNSLVIDGLEEGGVRLGKAFAQSRFTEYPSEDPEKEKKLGLVIREMLLDEKTNFLRRTLFGLYGLDAANQRIEDIHVTYAAKGGQKLVSLLKVTLVDSKGRRSVRRIALKHVTANLLFKLKEAPVSLWESVQDEVCRLREVNPTFAFRRWVPEQGRVFTSASLGPLGTVVTFKEQGQEQEHVFFTEEWAGVTPDSDEIAPLHSDRFWRAEDGEAPEERLARVRRALKLAAQALFEIFANTARPWTIKDSKPDNLHFQRVSDGRGDLKERVMPIDVGNVYYTSHPTDLLIGLTALLRRSNRAPAAKVFAGELRAAELLREGEGILRMDDLFEGILEADPFAGLELLLDADARAARGELFVDPLIGPKKNDEFRDTLRAFLRKSLSEGERRGVRILNGYADYVDHDFVSNTQADLIEREIKENYFIQLVGVVERAGDKAGFDEFYTRNRILIEKLTAKHQQAAEAIQKAMPALTPVEAVPSPQPGGRSLREGA